VKKPAGKHYIAEDLAELTDELGDDVEHWILAALDWDELAQAIETWSKTL